MNTARDYAKLNKGTIRCVNKIYRKKMNRKSKLHNAIIAASGYASILIFLVAVLCVETSTLKAMLVASIALAWFILFMFVNVDIINKRIKHYWEDKYSGK